MAVRRDSMAIMNGWSPFYLKVMMKNPLFFIYILLILFFIYFIKDTLHVSVFKFAKLFLHGYICSNLFFLITTSWVLSKRYESLVYLEHDLLKKQRKWLLSAFIISCLVSLLPIAAIIILKNPAIESPFIWKGVLHLFILWTISNMLATTIGSTVALLLRHRGAVFLSLVLYGWFLWKSMSITLTFRERLFNIFDDQLQVETSTITGTLFNVNYFLDKIYIILIILFLVLIIYCVYHSKKIVFIALTIAIFIGFGALPAYGEKHVQHIQTYPTAQFSHVPYTIQSYQMHLGLGNQLKNIVTMNLLFSASGHDLHLFLDDGFKVHSVKVNGSPIKFSHKNNVLTIHDPFKANEKKKVVVSYSGRIQIVDNLGVPRYYVSHDAVNLPGWIFAWYPTVFQAQPSFFDIRLDATMKVYANIGSSPVQTKLKGQTSSLSLFAGQYQKLIDHGITYILPINAQLKDYQRIIDEQLTKKDDRSPKDKSYHKVIVGSWPYNLEDELKWIGQTIIINYSE